MPRTHSSIDRRTLLIGGGAGVGLIVAWAVWPRTYVPNLAAGPDETVFGAWLKIGSDGRVLVAVPQVEHGQGVYTTLPQIIADELGADWRTVGVEPAPLNPLYANPLALPEMFEGLFDRLPEKLRETHATRTSLMLTGGSTSVRAFEHRLRDAGAAARILLCRAAAERWGVDWQACETANGFVLHDKQKLRFGDLAAEAAGGELPDTLPLRSGGEGRLYGTSVPRLDSPSKVDGSANFAGDVRLPGMVFAAVRQGPIGTVRLVSVNDEAARVPGMLHVVKNERWVATVASNWWVAHKALEALAPRFEIAGPTVDTRSIDTALSRALASEGQRIIAGGDLAGAFQGARLVTADYRVGLAVHAPMETATATAHYTGGRLTLWLPTQAPGLARAAAARAAGLGEDDVTVHAMLIGGSFGARLTHDAAEQAAILARQLGKPVQLTWSRSEDLLHDRYRPAAAARMSARLAPNGMVLGWLAKIAAPSAGREMARRMLSGDTAVATALALPGVGDPSTVAGALPVYRIPNIAIDHHPADIGVPTGYWRSGAHSYTAFFTECFLDELAHAAGIEAHSFRISMLGGEPRLARCLSTVATLGGWQGGEPGSGQGLACHSFRGSHIAVMAEASIGADQRIKVERIIAAVDCGRMVNPDVVLQQIEGGLIFGMAAALGASTGFTANVADARGFGDLRLPTLADSPDISVELIESDADPGGVSELAVPPVAPAIANAIHASTGIRLRTLPLVPGGA